jgi:DNA repair photolyase
MTNVEDYLHHLDKLMEAHPWQETYLLEDDADILCLEPELDCLGPVIEHFGKLDGRYVVLHTKSWNVDWMLNLKHNGNTIIVWSLAAPTQSTQIEPKTGTTEQRIEAARKCQEAGYTVRYKFKPIIPIEGWREEASQTIERVLTRTKPDVISLCVFMWMEIDDLKKRLHQHSLDADTIAAAEAAVEETKDTVTKPFPEDVRAEIYDHYLSEIRKWNIEVPVSLSTETFSIWRRFQSKLGMNATNYVCGCGPNAVPNRKCLATHPYRSAVRNDEGLRGTF